MMLDQTGKKLQTHLRSIKINMLMNFRFSNGTGKTSLLMSALWALTGSIDPRPTQDDKVSDIINDASKVSLPQLSALNRFQAMCLM